MTIYEENVLYDLTQIYSKLKKKKKLTNFKKVCLAIKTIESYNRPLIIRIFEYLYIVFSITLRFKKVKNLTIGRYQQRVNIIFDFLGIQHACIFDGEYINNIKIKSVVDLQKIFYFSSFPICIKEFYRKNKLSIKYSFNDVMLKNLAIYYNGEQKFSDDSLNYYTALKFLLLENKI